MDIPYTPSVKTTNLKQKSKKMKTKIKSIIGILLFVGFFGNRAVIAQSISFAAPVNIIGSGGSDLVACDDVNNDNRKDIVAINGYSLKVYLQTNSNSISSTPATYSIACPYPGPRSIDIGDLNNDGRNDIVIGFSDSIAIFYQNSTGTLNSQVNYITGGNDVDAVKCGDANNDGFNDVAVSLWNSAVISIFYGNSSGLLTKIDYPSVQKGYDHIDICKIGTDTINSVFKMCGQGYGPLIQYKIKTNKTIDTVIYRTHPPGSNFNGFCTSDIYEKGNRKVFASYGGNTPACAIWRNNLSAVADTSIPVYQCPGTMRSADLNGDGKDEIIVIHGGWNNLSIISSDTTQNYFVWCPNNASVNSISTGDINNDGLIDIITANTYSGLTVLINNTPHTNTKVNEIHNYNIRFYPNPFTDKINIETEVGSKFVFINTNGQVVYEGLIKDQHTELSIDVPPGIYFIEISNGEKISHQKVIKN